MSLPPNFNPWEQLQSVVLKTFNREVREEFSDITDDDGISTSRGSLKTACTVHDRDTAPMIIIRMLVFYLIVRKARDLMPPIYGVPEGSSRVSVVDSPRILLFFQEDYQDVAKGESPITGEISFRLTDETATSITESKLRSLATKIKNEFATGNGFVWNKGKNYYSYVDKEKGYQLKILATTESEAWGIVGKVLDIQNHTPDPEKFSISENKNPSSAFPSNPGTQVVLGRSRKKKRVRPVVNVRFQYATFTIQGVMRPIPLVDRSGIFRNALERVW
jgi:hypothetical protein